MTRDPTGAPARGTGAPLGLDRAQILAFRRRAGALDERLPPGPQSRRVAAWAGLQDSMPRAAVLSLHARVQGIEAAAWSQPPLVQIWGPRYSAYVVAEADVAPFTLGRLPDDARGRERAERMARLVREHLDARDVGSAPYDEIGGALGVHPNALRYASTTGTVRIHWDGARGARLLTAPAPEVEPAAARRELARRFLHVFGPGDATGFADWAGLAGRSAIAALASLDDSLTAVRTPVGEAWILSEDEPGFRDVPGPPAPVRLLPSGDALYLLQGSARELLVPNATRRGQLWTARVWPGALLLAGEIRGTWRRAKQTLVVSPWGAVSRAARAAVEAEAAGLPLPGLEGPVEIRWG